MKIDKTPEPLRIIRRGNGMWNVKRYDAERDEWYFSTILCDGELERYLFDQPGLVGDSFEIQPKEKETP